MAAGRIVVPPYFPARDRDFNLLSGALLYVYENETTAKALIYTDEALTVLAANPVIANSSGQFPAVYAEAGTEASPVLYSVSVTTSTGASPGNPFNFDNYRPSVDWETAASALAEAAAEAAAADAVQTAADAVQTAADLAAIEAIIADAPDAPSVLNKLNLDGDNVGSNSANLRSNIGAVGSTALAASSGAVLVGSILPLTGAVLRTVQDVLADTPNVEGLGVVSNGTSQTSAFVAALGNLDTDNYRGVVNVNPNTLFDIDTVFNAVPTGVILDGLDTLNWNDGGYRIKLRYQYSGDEASDDSQWLIGSSYHAVMTLMNRGNASGTSADGYFGSILHSIGQDLNNNPMPCNIATFQKDPSSDTWRWALRGQVPYLVAVANPQYWVTATVYAAGAYCVNSATGFVYKTTAGGTSGASVPTGTGTGINDGGVLWDYVQSNLNLDTTHFTFNLQTGNFAQYGPGSVRFEQDAGTQTAWLQLDTDGTWTARHEDMGLNAWVVSTAVGFSVGIGPSYNRLTISTATFDYPVTGAGKTTASSIAFCTPPVGRTRARLNIRFEGVTTVSDYFSGGGINFLLRDGTDVVPPDGAEMEFEYDTGFSSLWREVYRSFDALRKGTTAQRPVFGGGRGVGYYYLDTTLDADGKAIWWNGSAWVDATGTVV